MLKFRTYLRILLIFSFPVILMVKSSASEIPDSTEVTSNQDTTTAPNNDSLIIPPQQLDRVINNNAFHVGEKLSFNVRYGFIKAGEATMEVKGKVPIGDREAYEIISTANSTGTFDFFFKVRDRVESYIDTQGLFSWKFNKKLREGSYKFDLLVDYDQYNGKALVDMIRYNDNDDDSLTIRKQENFTVDIPPYVLDILAAFYYVRTQKLRIGMPIYLSNHDNKKVYDLRVIVQKRETIKVKAGKFRCIMVQPQLRGEAIFKQKGELWVWLSDDKYKIPVQMKSAVFVGSITTELTKIEGIKLPLPSQIK
jgi:hypothetical protein